MGTVEQKALLCPFTFVKSIKHTLTFPNHYAASTVSMYIILLFLLVESFIHPFIYALLLAASFSTLGRLEINDGECKNEKE